MTPARALDSSRAPFHRWCPDGRLNVCVNAVDRHVEAGRGEQPALVYDSPVTGTRRTYTYAQLRDEVAAFAGALARLGVGHGDRVVISMIPEAAITMLACARIGAIHSVVFGGFAPPELAVRIDDAAPKVIVSASCGIEGKRVIPYKPPLDRAIELAGHRPQKRVIAQRPQERAYTRLSAGLRKGVHRTPSARLVGHAGARLRTATTSPGVGISRSPDPSRKAAGQPIRCSPSPKSMRARSARETIPSLGNTLAR